MTHTTATESPKRRQFDEYWQTRDYQSADARTRQRIELCRELIVRKSGTVLDVGCGRGQVAEAFAALGYMVRGLDVSPLSIEWTRARGVEAFLCDIETETVTDSYDIILCLETLHYMANPRDVLSRLAAALTPGGELILSLPCEYHLGQLVARLRGAPDERSYSQVRFTPKRHRTLIAEAGLRIADHRELPLVPPRRPALAGLGKWLAGRAPSLFAISVMYRLKAAE